MTLVVTASGLLKRDVKAAINVFQPIYMLLCREPCPEFLSSFSYKLFQFFKVIYLTQGCLIPFYRPLVQEIADSS